MADRFINLNLGGIPCDEFTPTLSDTDDNLGAGHVGIWISATGAGNVSLTTLDGTTRTFALAADGTKDFAFRRVRSTGTTATGITVRTAYHGVVDL